MTTQNMSPYLKKITTQFLNVETDLQELRDDLNESCLERHQSLKMKRIELFSMMLKSGASYEETNRFAIIEIDDKKYECSLETLKEFMGEDEYGIFFSHNETIEIPPQVMTLNSDEKNVTDINQLFSSMDINANGMSKTVSASLLVTGLLGILNNNNSEDNNKEVSLLKDENKTLETEVSSLKDENKSLAAEVTELAHELSLNKEELRTATENKDNALKKEREANQKLKDEINSQKTSLKQSLDKNALYEQQIHDLKHKSESLSDITNKNNDLSAENKNLKKQLSEIKEEKNTISNKVSELEKKVSSFESNKDKATDLQKKIDSLTADLDASGEKNKTLEKTIRELNVELKEKETASSASTEMEEELKKIKAANEDLQATNSRLSTKNLELTDEVRGLELKISKFENQPDIQKDAVTGLGNGLAFNNYLNEVMDSNQKKSASLILVDINGLREYNQSFGRNTADNVVRALKDKLVSEFGENNVFKLNNEFGIITQTNADTITHRMKEITFELAPIPKGDEGDENNIYITYGIVKMRDNSNLDKASLINAAYDKLYDAKRRFTYVKTNNKKNKPIAGVEVVDVNNSDTSDEMLDPYSNTDI